MRSHRNQSSGRKPQTALERIDEHFRRYNPLDDPETVQLIRYMVFGDAALPDKEIGVETTAATPSSNETHAN
jgi:hypothetical protein